MHININNSVSFSLFGVKGSSAINGSLSKASISPIRYYDFCSLSISLTKPFSNALIASLDEYSKTQFPKIPYIQNLYNWCAWLERTVWQQYTRLIFSLYSLVRARFRHHLFIGFSIHYIQPKLIYAKHSKIENDFYRRNRNASLLGFNCDSPNNCVFKARYFITLQR